MGDVNPQRGNLGFPTVRRRPHARQTHHTPRRNAKVRAGPDENFFQAANVLDGAQHPPLLIRRTERPEIEDGITDELSRAVESYISATVAFKKLHTALGKLRGRGNYIRGFRVPSERDDWGVLKQKEYVTDAAVLAKLDQLLLQTESGGVIEGPELEHGDQNELATDLRRFAGIFTR